MGSIREQLSKLFNKRQKKPKQTQENVFSAGEDSLKPENLQGWKAGVRPLSKRTDRVPRKNATSQPKRPNQHYPSTPPCIKKKTSQHSATRRAETQQNIAIRTSRPLTAPAPSKPPPPKPPETTKPNHNQVHQPPNTKLTTAEEFRYPEPWVKEGRYLQPPSSQGGRILSVRVGIDFGTAYTKVAVRLADSVFAVDFHGITNRIGGAFLLPGEISIDSSQTAWIGRHPDAHERISGLKIPFLSKTDTAFDGKINAVLFLAWVMRYTRAWIFKNLRELISGRTLTWELNVGIPSSSWVDQRLNHRYEGVLHAAWQLSKENGDLDYKRAREILLSTRPSLSKLELDDLRLVPEFVSQMASYVLSSQKPEKGEELHLLVDVGAGTVDIACFGAYRPHNEFFYEFPTWASTVEPLGTHFLMKERNTCLVGNMNQWNDFSGVPDSSEFAKAHGCPKVLNDNYFGRWTTTILAGCH